MDTYYQTTSGDSSMSEFLVYDYDLKLNKDEELLIYVELFYGKEKKQFSYNGEYLDSDYFTDSIRTCKFIDESNVCKSTRTKGILLLNISRNLDGTFNVRFYNPGSSVYSPMVKIDYPLFDGSTSQVQDLDEPIHIKDLKINKEIILGKIIYGQSEEDIEIILKAKLQKILDEN